MGQSLVVWNSGLWLESLCHRHLWRAGWVQGPVLGHAGPRGRRTDPLSTLWESAA